MTKILQCLDKMSQDFGMTLTIVIGEIKTKKYDVFFQPFEFY